MEIEQLVGILDDSTAARPWLERLGLTESQRAHQCLTDIAQSGVPLDLLSSLCDQLEKNLPTVGDPDLALENLAKYFGAVRSPLSLATLFDRESDALRTVLQMGATSQYLSDWLLQDPESLDLLRMTEGQPVARQVLLDEICAEASAIDNDAMLRALIRRYKRRETLRIAYGDLVRQQPLEVVAKQLSYLADAILEATVRFARRQLSAKRGEARGANGDPGRFAVIALGEWGGEELNYGGELELLFLCDAGVRMAQSRTHDGLEFFESLAQRVVELIRSVDGADGYQADLSMVPSRESRSMVMTLDAALRYYDVSGRAHERLAFVKSRWAAGSESLGRSFLRQMETWVYRRYLGAIDIAGIKALKRKIEQRAEPQSGNDVHASPGGIQDIEFVIQFLQLLNGGDLQPIRIGNTLAAIRALESNGCLSHQERTLLEENYVFLRQVEHRQQIMFPALTTALSAAGRELEKLALRLGFAPVNGQTGADRLTRELEKRRQESRQILDHLLHDAFEGSDDVDPIADLILDPQPSGEMVERLLGEYGFKSIRTAHRHLSDLAEEHIPFLSTRRCRYFLAGIASRLLAAVAQTPDPDGALQNLVHVSNSLGGKGVLWELFSYSPPTLQLYVRLCATSDYLTGILNAQPGMIDELMDSLVLDRLSPLGSLERQLADLCRGADDQDPILTSFKNLQHLRIGVRDVLGKNDIQASHGGLADIAEAIVKQVADFELQKLVQKHGPPMLADTTRSADFLVMAQGKFGAREPNYHSDLDLVFLYEGNGQTEPQGRSQKQTNNQHFFGQLAQRIIKRMTHLGITGRLYNLDSRLRPEGSGLLAFSLNSLLRFFDKRADWRLRMALCKARIVYGSEAGKQRAMHAIRASQFLRPWTVEDRSAQVAYRKELEDTASLRNLKRGPGGAIDVEHIVQDLQMTHGKQRNDIVIPNTLEALGALRQAELVSREDTSTLSEGYRFLRTVESRLRLLNTVKRHDLPTDAMEMSKLAYLLEMPSPDALEAACAEQTALIRAVYLRLMQ